MWVRGHSRSLKVVPFESLGTISYSLSIVTMAVSLAISDLEIWVWGCSKSLKIRAAVGMGIPMGFPWVWVWDGYGDYDESPWVCGDSMGIFEWIPNYVETS